MDAAQDIQAGTRPVATYALMGLSAAVVFLAGCYLYDVLTPGGDLLGPLVQAGVLSYPAFALWRSRGQRFARVRLTDDRLTVFNLGKPPRIYHLSELGAWGNVNVPHFGREPLTSATTSLRITSVTGEEVVTLPPGLFGRGATELRRALTGRLPFADDLRTPIERGTARETKLRWEGITGIALVLGALFITLPGDRLLQRAHVYDERLDARLTAAPQVRLGHSFVSLDLPVDLEGGSGGTWTILADSLGTVDTTAVLRLAAGDAVQLSRAWWPGNTPTDLLFGESDRPRNAKHLYRDGELILHGVSADERPLGPSMWAALFLGISLVLVGLCARARARGPSTAATV